MLAIPLQPSTRNRNSATLGPSAPQPLNPEPQTCVNNGIIRLVCCPY